MKIRVGDAYASFEGLTKVAAQEMDIEQAEVFATFLEAFLKEMQPIDFRRNELLGQEYVDQDERMRVFDTFADQKIEVPDFNIKDLKDVRIAPDALLVFKRAGLYA